MSDLSGTRYIPKSREELMAEIERLKAALATAEQHALDNWHKGKKCGNEEAAGVLQRIIDLSWSARAAAVTNKNAESALDHQRTGNLLLEIQNTIRALIPQPTS